MKQRLNEYLEIRKKDDIIELGKQIYADMLPVITTKVPVRNKRTKTYNLQLSGENISIIVNFPAVSNLCYYYHEEKQLIINVHTGWSQSTFLMMFFHEMTHAIDFINNEQGNRGNFGYSYSGNGTFTFANSKTLDLINDILYRLWDKKERTAYQTISLKGDEFVTQWVNTIKEKIDTLCFQRKTKSNEAIWTYVMNRIPSTPQRYRNNWLHFKQYFIKKSYYLLGEFEKGCRKNAKYWQNKPFETIAPNANSPFIAKMESANRKTEIDNMMSRLGKRLINAVWDTEHIVKKDQHDNWWIIENVMNIADNNVRILIKKDSYQESVDWYFPDLGNEHINLSSLGCDYYDDFYDNNMNTPALRKLGRRCIQIMKQYGLDVSQYTV